MHISREEIPEVDDPTLKLLTLARRIGLRIGTCSTKVVELAGVWELPVVDLRAVAPSPRPIICLVRCSSSSSSRKAANHARRSVTSPTATWSSSTTPPT